MTDDDTAFDNWAHDNVPELVYEGAQVWENEHQILRPSEVRSRLRAAFIAGIEHRDSQLPRMPW